ncbi:hypothetical protein [Peribacillus alkalitolerans]|uniref:hypothetical protein n=1 Tax=Peribacillus alkalitolerans TaxID=1550385 RepID=UPI0013CFECEF|nr:hypothetical protein [Peribacillus alkalitolerans]
MKKCILFIIAIVALTGCKEKVPEPETKIIGMDELQLETKSVEATSPILTNQTGWEVKYFVRGNDVFVDCYVKGASFQNSGRAGAKIEVLIDGKKYGDMTTAAFIIKGLSKGNHTIALHFKDGDRKYIRKKLAIQIQ